MIFSTNFVSAQMGPPSGAPTIFTLEALKSDSEKLNGIENQLQLTLAALLWKSDRTLLTSTFTYQAMSLVHAPFAAVNETRFDSAMLNVQALIDSPAEDGWTLGASFGSASDNIFSNSDVLTYNLNVQRRNQLSPTTAFHYGFFYSNNAAILPGLPIPALTYEIFNKETGDLFRLGFPLLIRQNNILPQTQWGLFAVGPIIWDVFLKNTTFNDYHFTLGLQKRPETFLLSEPIPSSPLSQLMIEHTSMYAMIELKHWPHFTLGARVAYHFNNRFRLRETGTTRDDFDQKKTIQDYGFVGLNLKIHAPKHD